MGSDMEARHLGLFLSAGRDREKRIRLVELSVVRNTLFCYCALHSMVHAWQQAESIQWRSPKLIYPHLTQGMIKLLVSAREFKIAKHSMVCAAFRK